MRTGGGICYSETTSEASLAPYPTDYESARKIIKINGLVHFLHRNSENEGPARPIRTGLYLDLRSGFCSGECECYLQFCDYLQGPKAAM